MISRRSPAISALPAQEIVIEYATEADLPGMYEIERLSFRCHWSYRALAEEVTMERPTSHVLVVKLGKRVVGFAIFWDVVGEAHIIDFAVHPNFRRLGIGTRLMDAVLERARELNAERATLEVRVSNESAIRLYEKFGFNVAGIRRKFYLDNNEDAYIMWIDDLSAPRMFSRVEAENRERRIQP